MYEFEIALPLGSAVAACETASMHHRQERLLLSGQKKWNMLLSEVEVIQVTSGFRHSMRRYRVHK